MFNEDSEDFQDLLDDIEFISSKEETLDILEKVDKNETFLNKASEDGSTLLHYASSNNNLTLVKGFVERGVDIHQQNKRGEDALFLAAQSNCLKVASFLLDQGANPSTQSKKYSALAEAALVGHKKMVLLLLARGANSLAVCKGSGMEDLTLLQHFEQECQLPYLKHASNEIKSHFQSIFDTIKCHQEGKR